MSSFIYQNCVQRAKIDENFIEKVLKETCQTFLYEKISGPFLASIGAKIYSALRRYINMNGIDIKATSSKDDPNSIKVEFFRAGVLQQLVETSQGVEFVSMHELKLKPKTKIAIGCGTRFYGDDWLHNDIVEHSHVDHIGPAHMLPQIESNSMDLVYASHVLEYYSWEEAKSLVLPEWKRILKPGGTLRIAVPNFYILTKWYQMKYDLGAIIGPLFGQMLGDTDYIFHKCTYDSYTLGELLGDVGFKNIDFWDWQETEHAQVDDHSQAYLPKVSLDDPEKKFKDVAFGTLISLNMECIK